MKYLFLLLAMLSLASCDKKEEVIDGKIPSPWTQSYIIQYLCGHYEVSQVRNSAQWDVGFYGGIYAYPSPDVSARTTLTGVRPPEEQWKEFKYLSERNGDLSFNRHMVNYPGERWAWADNFREIHVVCRNRDLDEAHPAGSRIDDLLQVRFHTFAPYVRSGYEGKYLTFVRKKLSDLKEDEAEMIHHSPMVFEFFDVTGMTGEYEMEVPLVTVEGETRVAEGTLLFGVPVEDERYPWTN